MSNPSAVTILEIERWLGTALAAPASADNAAKAKFKFAESRRFIKKKFEPTFRKRGGWGRRAGVASRAERGELTRFFKMRSNFFKNVHKRK